MIARPRSVHGFGKVVLGYYQYHAVPGNSTQLRIFCRRVCRLWRSILVRRSQRARVRWERLSPLLIRWIPQPRILHPYPDARLPLLIQGKSRMRKRACTDLCGGRSAMVVPTATTGPLFVLGFLNFPLALLNDCESRTRTRAALTKPSLLAIPLADWASLG